MGYFINVKLPWEIRFPHPQALDRVEGELLESVFGYLTAPISNTGQQGLTGLDVTLTKHP